MQIMITIGGDPEVLQLLLLPKGPDAPADSLMGFLDRVLPEGTQVYLRREGETRFLALRTKHA